MGSELQKISYNNRSSFVSACTRKQASLYSSNDCLGRASAEAGEQRATTPTYARRLWSPFLLTSFGFGM